MKKDVIGLIPAAGKGVRLGLPYPKELYPIILNDKYKPVADFVFDLIRGADVKHIVFVINETKHQLIGYYRSGSKQNISISYVVQEDASNGTPAASPGLSHALDSAYHLTRCKTVCFGMPDTIIKPGNVFQKLLKKDDDITLGLFKTNTPERFGMVETDKKGSVLRIIDKPNKTTLKYMWGCMVWSPRFTEYLHKKVQEGVSDFAEIINTSIEKGFKVGSVKIINGVYVDIGVPDNIKTVYDKIKS